MHIGFSRNLVTILLLASVDFNDKSVKHTRYKTIMDTNNFIQFYCHDYIIVTEEIAFSSTEGRVSCYVIKDRIARVIDNILLNIRYEVKRDVINASSEK